MLLLGLEQKVQSLKYMFFYYLLAGSYLTFAISSCALDFDCTATSLAVCLLPGCLLVFRGPRALTKRFSPHSHTFYPLRHFPNSHTHFSHSPLSKSIHISPSSFHTISPIYIIIISSYLTRIQALSFHLYHTIQLRRAKLNVNTTMASPKQY